VQHDSLGHLLGIWNVGTCERTCPHLEHDRQLRGLVLVGPCERTCSCLEHDRQLRGLVLVGPCEPTCPHLEHDRQLRGLVLVGPCEPTCPHLEHDRQHQDCAVDFRVASGSLPLVLAAPSWRKQQRLSCLYPLLSARNIVAHRVSVRTQALFRPADRPHSHTHAAAAAAAAPAAAATAPEDRRRARQPECRGLMSVWRRVQTPCPIRRSLPA